MYIKTKPKPKTRVYSQIIKKIKVTKSLKTNPKHTNRERVSEKRKTLTNRDYSYSSPLSQISSVKIYASKALIYTYEAKKIPIDKKRSRRCME